MANIENETITVVESPRRLERAESEHVRYTNAFKEGGLTSAEPVKKNFFFDRT